jgi:hypothetical protein
MEPTHANKYTEDLDNDLIDVDPEYQREVVWTGILKRNVFVAIQLTFTSS